jgi:hypothetical protein
MAMIKAPMTRLTIFQNIVFSFFTPNPSFRNVRLNRLAQEAKPIYTVPHTAFHPYHDPAPSVRTE